MTWFRRPKNREAATPQLCQLCRERLGTILLSALSRAPARLKQSAEQGAGTWWVCEICASQFGHEEPPNS
jgi:hypothetical protein